MSKDNSTNTGIGSFSTLLFIVFLVLKLCHVIDWSWWYVCMPLYGGAAIAMVLYVIFIIISPFIGNKKPDEPVKSKWQQRYDEMMENQKRLKR